MQRKWLVLLAAFYANACSAGLVTNLSVLYVEWLTAFGRSKAETAAVQSVCTGGYNIAGACTGVLVTQFGPRMIGMISATVSALGFVLSFFATSVTYLIVVFGVLTAVGTSGMFVSAATIVGQYFEGKQRQRALSFMSFGTGVGGIFFSYILNVLSLQYGWRGCMLLTGGFVLQTVPFFAICKMKNPIIPHKYIDTITDSRHEELSNDSYRKSLTEQLTQLARNKLFYLNCFAFCCIIWTFMSSLIFVDFFETVGFSREDAVYLYLIMAVSNAVFRLTPGLMKQINHFSTFGIIVFHSAVGTVAFFAFPHIQTFFTAAILMGCIGLSMGGTLGSVIHLTILKVTDTRCFSLGLGILMTIGGICRLIAGPVTGYIWDVTGSYDISFYVNGSVGCCGVLLNALLLYLHSSWRIRQSKVTSINIDITD